MEKLTVLQLSKRTGLSRTQIYYLKRHEKINIINGKIDLNEAMPAIVELLDKKSNKDNEITFKQILNLLISQNILLQTQLNLAHEREKAYLTELTCYRQSLAPKTTPHPPIIEGHTQALLENNGFDSDENSHKPIQSKSENQASLESCQSINKETKLASEAGPSPLPTKSLQNEMILSESKSWDTRPKNESTEQNAGALIDTHIPTQNETKLRLNKNTKKTSTAQVVKRTAKNVSIIPTPCKSDRTPINKSIEDQDKIDKKDHHNYEQ
ncbi:hypothetical protein KTI63_07005 [Acinetobacter guillouiae]|uniref:hypothetical protein n=1 Tax=Acinetobacter guillouiae TaxID=106649 RepID=UPI0021CED038|nr:hypothetical protein [Acinetobacter guillouiae]MCU4492222.1 hypothetical protein [Acinetobacter guillouiae]